MSSHIDGTSYAVKIMQMTMGFSDRHHSNLTKIRKTKWEKHAAKLYFILADLAGLQTAPFPRQQIRETDLDLI